jgi:hypothetical protein
MTMHKIPGYNSLREMSRDVGRSATAIKRDMTRGYCPWPWVKPPNAKGYTTHDAYLSWNSMKQRCNNPKSTNYIDYGGRGITVCERWQNSFSAFLEDVGPRPSKEHSLDRIDSHGNYEPGNCKWELPLHQTRTRRWSDSEYRIVQTGPSEWLVEKYYTHSTHGSKEEAEARLETLYKKDQR